jgi:GDP-D-mannose dehydratase
MPKITTTQPVNRNIINSENYAKMRDKGFTNHEIEAMWMMPRQAIAAFQAWNTMSNRTWKSKDIEAIKI